METKIISLEPILKIGDPSETICYDLSGLTITFWDGKDKIITVRFRGVDGMKFVTRDMTYDIERKYQGTLDDQSIPRTLKEVIPARWYGHFMTSDDNKVDNFINNTPYKLRHFVMEFVNETLEVLASGFEIVSIEDDPQSM